MGDLSGRISDALEILMPSTKIFRDVASIRARMEFGTASWSYRPPHIKRRQKPVADSEPQVMTDAG
jgi:hypothetical protein